MAAGVVSRIALVLPLLVVLCCSCGEARALFDELLAAFDPSGLGNATSLLEQFFASHAQHSLASFGELADIAQIFFSGK